MEVQLSAQAYSIQDTECIIQALVATATAQWPCGVCN